MSDPIPPRAAPDEAGPFPIVTARTRVRRLRVADLPAFQAVRHAPGTGRWQGWVPVDDDTARAFLEEMAAGSWWRPGAWCQFAIAGREDDRLLGDIGVRFPDDVADPLEIGFSLGPPSQGRGLAAESVRATLLALLAARVARGAVAVTDTRNAPSIRLLERLGFRLDHTEAAVARGEACEEHHFVLDASAAPVASGPARPGPPTTPSR
jgi:RimJ/RimL family protein N-acetyltransferase